MIAQEQKNSAVRTVGYVVGLQVYLKVINNNFLVTLPSSRIF